MLLQFLARHQAVCFLLAQRLLQQSLFLLLQVAVGLHILELLLQELEAFLSGLALFFVH